MQQGKDALHNNLVREEKLLKPVRPQKEQHCVVLGKE
jgi:hypothetical protein